MNKKTIGFFAFTFLTATLFAQQSTEQVEMADDMVKSGKIYVVITVLSIIFAGILIYLISIDRKVSKLEKELKK